MLDVSGDRFVQSGSWDSIHVIEAVETVGGGSNNNKANSNTTTYKLTTTIMLHIGIDKVELGKTVLSGSLTRQVICVNNTITIIIIIVINIISVIINTSIFPIITITNSYQYHFH